MTTEEALNSNTREALDTYDYRRSVKFKYSGGIGPV